jgi:hypothetical protein
MKIKITNEQKVTLTLAPVTAAGRPAVVDGIPLWAIQSGESQIDVAADGRSATFISSDLPGTTVTLVTADADLGEGVERVQTIIELEVVSAKASALGFKVNDPELK